MKKQMWCLVVFALFTAILAGCGVPQADYDALTGELQSAVEEYKSLEGEVETLKADVNTAAEAYTQCEGDLDTAMSEIEFAKGEIAALQTDGDECTALVDEWVVVLDLVRVKMEIVTELFEPTFFNEDLGNPDRIATVGALVAQVGEADLTAKYDAWAASPTDNDLAIEFLAFVLESVNEDLS